MPALICPLCRTPLSRHDNSQRCLNNHSFDIAREGYLNLLLVQQKKSKAPGDNPEMVKARREFLQAGHYQPLCEAATALLQPLNAQTLVDIGCGEGYYTQAFSQMIPDILGLDIAKPAVQLAAKKHPHMTWLVASATLIPVADSSMDVVSSLFSPLPVAEMARVLKQDGHVLVVRPADTHLWTVRAALFGEVQAHQPDKFLEELQSHFSLQQQHDVRFPLTLNQQALKQLLAMTPYVWKARPENRLALEQHQHFATEAAFSVMLLQKNSAKSTS